MSEEKEEKNTGAAAPESEGPIGPKDLFGIVYYEYGEAFYGSVGNMRYRVAREPLKNVHFTPPDARGEEHLKAVVWRGPYNYAVTPPAQKTEKLFPCTAEGLAQVREWLNRCAADFR